MRTSIYNDNLEFPFLFFLFLYFIQMDAGGQTKFTDDLEVSTNYHYGFIIPEYSSLTYLVEDNVQSLSINLSRKTTGKNFW
ncbi:MAG: hypothetical protein WEB30_04040, partial [Cyclobacteriaceae bacterium]